MKTQLFRNKLKNLAAGLLVTLLAGFTAMPAHAARTTTFYHTDHLGSVVALSNESGEVIRKTEFHDFGSAKIRFGSNEEQQADRLGYTGKYFDEHTNTLYLGARFYDPDLGRFLTPDPVGFNEHNLFMFNRYAYGNNSPYLYVDPDGKKAIVVGGRDVANNYLENIRKFDSSAALTKIGIDRFLLSNDGKGTSPGNLLISKIVSDDNVAYLMDVSGKMGVAGNVPMTESNPQVQIDFSKIAGVELRLINNGKSYYTYSDPAAVVAHELIHALNGMEGIVDRTVVSYLFMGVNGKKRLGQDKIEELRTVGVSHQRRDGISENAIRGQLGLDLREGYGVSANKKF